MIRKANEDDLSRIAEIQIFNYRLNFYPIFQSDAYFFGELQVPSLMKDYETNPDGIWHSEIFGRSLNEMVEEGIYPSNLWGVEDEEKE